MTSERSKRRDFLSLIFISKSISKKLLITFNNAIFKWFRTIFSLGALVQCFKVAKIYPV